MSQFDCRRPGEIPLHEKDSTEARIEAARNLAEVELNSGRGQFWFTVVIASALVGVGALVGVAKNWEVLFGSGTTYHEVEDKLPPLNPPKP